jgi:predicted flap endonuclease-1-like 5' DNA nuclease
MPSIDAIQGLSRAQARTLRRNRVRTTEALLRKAATKSERRSLAKETGLDESEILAWVNRADLMRIKGVGEEYADLLEVAGIDTVKELRRRNPRSLLRQLTELNEKKNLVRRLPTESMVEGWVAEAKTMQPGVSY